MRRFRDLGDSLHLIDLGGDVSGEGMGKLIVTILAAVAEAERDRIRERIRDVKKDQAERARYLDGRKPLLSIVRDGEVCERDDAAEIVADMRRQRQAGSSFRAIAAAVAGRYGVEMAHTSVRRILADAA